MLKRGKSILTILASAWTLFIPPAAADPIFGRWAAEPAQCVDALALTVSANALQRGSDRCTMGKVYKVGRALYVQARCTGAKGRQSVGVKFDLVDLNHLAVTWDKNPAEQMTRCR